MKKLEQDGTLTQFVTLSKLVMIQCELKPSSQSGCCPKVTCFQQLGHQIQNK